jgi:hypothetical protein
MRVKRAAQRTSCIGHGNANNTNSAQKNHNISRVHKRIHVCARRVYIVIYPSAMYIDRYQTIPTRQDCHDRQI